MNNTGPLFLRCWQCSNKERFIIVRKIITRRCSKYCNRGALRVLREPRGEHRGFSVGETGKASLEEEPLKLDLEGRRAEKRYSWQRKLQVQRQ